MKVLLYLLVSLLSHFGLHASVHPFAVVPLRNEAHIGESVDVYMRVAGDEYNQFHWTLVYGNRSNVVASGICSSNPYARIVGVPVERSGRQHVVLMVASSTNVIIQDCGTINGVPKASVTSTLSVANAALGLALGLLAFFAKDWYSKQRRRREVKDRFKLWVEQFNAFDWARTADTLLPPWLQSVEWDTVLMDSTQIRKITDQLRELQRMKEAGRLSNKDTWESYSAPVRRLCGTYTESPLLK